MNRLDSALAGTPLKDFTCEVNWRATMNYSAALADNNPRYFDDERPAGIIAHPIFPVAVTWNILGCLADFIDSANFPLELIPRQVHHTEHLELHRPVTPGMKLTIGGMVAAILPHRAGTRVILRLDAEDGEGPVFTEHIGGLLRGVECAGGGSGEENLPSEPKNTDNNRLLWENRVRIDPLLPFVYDGCSDIFFPIHTSKRFARQVGLPGIILQGTCTLALAVTEIVNREPGSDPSLVKAVGCRFTGMVLPGDEISVRLTGKERGNLFFEVINGRGEKALSRGQIKTVSV